MQARTRLRDNGGGFQSVRQGTGIGDVWSICSNDDVVDGAWNFTEVKYCEDVQKGK